MDGVPPNVRVGGQPIGGSGGGYGDHVRQVKSGRVHVVAHVVVLGVISCSGDKEDPLLLLRLDRVVQSLGKIISGSPPWVDDPTIAGGDDVDPLLLHGL